jgi:hypothetical protein
MLDHECARIQFLRYQIVREMGELDGKRDHYAAWPKAVSLKFAALSGEQNKLREEWLKLGCGSQIA